MLANIVQFVWREVENVLLVIGDALSWLSRCNYERLLDKEVLMFAGVLVLLSVAVLL